MLFLSPDSWTHCTPHHLLFVSFLQYVFDYQDGDVFGCVADIGWITGHSYVVYGPLCNGATTVLFESTPVYPNPGMSQNERLLLVQSPQSPH